MVWDELYHLRNPHPSEFIGQIKWRNYDYIKHIKKKKNNTGWYELESLADQEGCSRHRCCPPTTFPVPPSSRNPDFVHVSTSLYEVLHLEKVTPSPAFRMGLIGLLLVLSALSVIGSRKQSCSMRHEGRTAKELPVKVFSLIRKRGIKKWPLPLSWMLCLE